MAPGLAAQGYDPMQRGDFVFHITVDPLYGDNVLASNPTDLAGLPAPFNPLHWNGGGTPPAHQRRPLLPHPLAPPVGSGPSGWIQHAPFAFRTVTAAVAYINLNFPGGMPYTVPGTSNPTRRVKYIVIHCKPGIYAPVIGAEQDPIDPKSGLPFNGSVPSDGENFPIALPEGVCIQGTSALDTIFDGRGVIGTNIFWINPPSPISKTEDYAKTFIDSVTIRGARADPLTSPTGIGVTIWGAPYAGHNWRPIISNCFITDNDVGIMVDGGQTVEGQPLFVHSPLIVNNTIAWNRCGVWNGVIAPVTGAEAATSRPRLLNNIIDARDPYGTWTATGTSAFEGIHPSDLTILQVTPSGGSAITLNVDFNAYDPSAADRRTAFIPGFRATWARGTSQGGGALPFSPRVDLKPYVYLYINELFRQAQGVDRSPHDFRLSPQVYFDNPPPALDSPVLNPLVNMGIDTASGTLRWQNYLAGTAPDLTRAPGLVGPGRHDQGNDTEFATIHSWDWDCEGFGNPRIWGRPGFTDAVFPFTNIDLGADEMGILILAGFIDRTRIFSRFVPDPKNPGQYLGITDHTQMYFIDLPSLFGPGTYPRPQFSQYTGGRLGLGYDWWPWAQGKAGAANFWPFSYLQGGTTLYTSNYTIGEPNQGGTPAHRSRATAYPAAPWEPFMRNLECDFSAHLIADFHPLWGFYFSTLPGSWLPDEFASNPWYHHNNSTAALWDDNHWLYYKPTAASNPSAVYEGTINPPGTWLYTPGPIGFIGLFVNAQFGPIGFTPPPPYTTYTVDVWGIGDTLGPDIVPDTSWLGMRANCEVGPGSSNLQTGLGINGVLPEGASAPASAGAMTKPAKAKLPRPTTRLEFERAKRRLRLKR